MATHAKIHQLTPEQLALAKARKEKKERLAQQGNPTADRPTSLLARAWLPIHNPRIERPNPPAHKAKVMTWNLLAQCLIRRELFPNSDCLKVGQREPLIHEEILRQNADVLCFQEVDRLDKLLPMLEKAGYEHCYASGPRKLHGCLIAYKKHSYSLVSKKTVFYDDEIPGADAQYNVTGASFKTRNIGFMVALRNFNFTPNDPAYSLVTGDTLLSPQKDTIKPSRVVHSSIDPSILINATSITIEDESEDVDPDRVIVNARPPRPEDGILTISEIERWFATLPKPVSAYNVGLRTIRGNGDILPTFGTRTELPLGRNGYDEPEYTSYTHYWHLTLAQQRPIAVSGLLSPLSESDMTPGLPLKRVSGSDHTCLVAELNW
uniref:Endonuclease/exonuclease/phosphatase domain-containing protein n=1 Tax=Psilocybe cubensis TaxID=181762 RepID=A0A8H8CQR4_PSICU